MIKFFRKIRQKLLTEGKLQSYFFYAVGEILLVVIGILIALQINNWNENRKNTKEEVQILKQLRSEFETNLNQLEDKIALHENMIRSGQEILSYIDDFSKLKNKDTLTYLLSNTLLAPTFDASLGVTNDIINSGKLYLIQNDNLRQLISGWSGDIVFATEEEFVWKSHRDAHYILFLINNYSYRNIANPLFINKKILQTALFGKDVAFNGFIGKSNKKFNTKHFVLNTELEDHLSNMLVFNQVAKHQLEGLKGKVETIVQLIDSEIENK